VAGKEKIPTYLQPQDGGIAGFAGLYEFWRDPEIPEGEEGDWLMTTTILTRPAAVTRRTNKWVLAARP
jgi:putative SOS response-associated peptidase YedK